MNKKNNIINQKDFELLKQRKNDLVKSNVELKNQINDLNALNEVLAVSMSIGSIWVQKTRRVLKKWWLDSKNIDVIIQRSLKHIKDYKIKSNDLI